MDNKTKKIIPTCFIDENNCHESCPYGGWRGGTCGAQHLIDHGGSNIDECDSDGTGGSYQLVQIKNGEAIFVCDYCNDVLKEDLTIFTLTGLKECVECGDLFNPTIQEEEDISCQECIDKRNSDIK